MTHNSRLVRRICIATGCTASVALLLAACYFGATFAQTPPAEPNPAPVAPIPDQAPAPPATPAVPSQAYSPISALQAQPSPAANPNQEMIGALRARMQELQSKLTRTPTTIQEQAEQQSIAFELSSLQSQIQRLEMEAAQFGQYADYRRMREQQAGGMPDPTSPAGTGIFAHGNPLAQQPRPDGFAGANPALAEPAALSEGEAALLREQKDALTQRFHQLQQAIRSLMPGDEALAENLKKEQDVVLEQLRDVNLRLANAPATPATPIVSTPTPFQIPAANQLPNLANATLPNSDLSVKTQKVQQAVQLLREAGLTQLAGYAANEIPRMATPNYVETPLTPGAWAEGSGLAEERYNPFQQISAKDVEGITGSIDELKKRVDSLAETLANVETQLKLLTRQQVSGYVPTAQPSPEASASVPASEPESPATSAPEPTAEPVAE